ncbi:hypothetical protein [Streptomyces sp. NPDC005078]|uniref:hypothetical protein n=1 Tax=Streptomyces sp. NPDC005078 TaxID=3154293 RepID=UPI00339F01C8
MDEGARRGPHHHVVRPVVVEAPGGQLDGAVGIRAELDLRVEAQLPGRAAGLVRHLRRRAAR